jgi:hypothetical protein
MMWAGLFILATVASFAVCVASVAMQPTWGSAGNVSGEPNRR